MDGEQPDTGAQGEGDGRQGDGTGTEPQQQDPAAETAKWKAMARKHEQQAKANADAAARLAAIEESQKTEQQKLADRAEAAERRAAAAELAVLRAEVASAKGVPAGLAARLSGTTREDLEADADALLQHLGQQKSPKPPPADQVAGNGGRSGGTPADQFAALVRGG